MDDILLEIGEKVREISPISPHTMKILELISDPEYSVTELKKILELDVSLTARCLKLVNSAAFGLRTDISTMDKAVNYIGSKQLMDMIISSDFDNVYNPPLIGYKAEDGDLWAHSLRTAIGAKLFADLTDNYSLSNQAYTAGLLHDIGKIIIDQFLHVSPALLQKRFEIGKETDFLEIETELLRTDHAEVGQMMALKWGLPEVLQIVIRYHHNPHEAPPQYRKLCVLVHLGDLFAALGGFSTGVDSLAYRLNPLAKKYLKFSHKVLEKLICDIDAEYNRAFELIEEDSQ
ncbi:MAG: HDOD domain-containing protein [bacterium]|nr:HDOD domain-containing protein [bacterium]